jgi:hypothetical protein
MNLILSKFLKSVEKKFLQSSCYGLDVMRHSCRKENMHCFIYWCCKAMTDKRYDGFTELYIFRECFSGSMWRDVPS